MSKNYLGLLVRISVHDFVDCYFGCLQMAKEIIDKVMKTLKNDGTFGNLVRRAVTELEEEGFMDQLRVRIVYLFYFVPDRRERAF